MKLQQYSILQLSARSILLLANKTGNGYRFYFDTQLEINKSAIEKTVQDDCGLYRQMLAVLGVNERQMIGEVTDVLESALVYLDFSGIFHLYDTEKANDMQALAEWLFRPEGIELDFGRGPVRFLAFERSASMSRENKLAFIREDLYAPLWERITLGMTIGRCQLSKLYAYNGLMFTSGRVIDSDEFCMDDDHIIVIDNPRSLVPNVSVITVEDDGTDAPIRRYSRVEKTMDVEVLEFDGEGLISTELGFLLDPYSYEIHDHHSFQIRMPYIKGVVHEVDFHALFGELGVEELIDIEGVHHPVAQVDMILTKSMCKGWGWMQENGLDWREYLARCRKYGHRLYVSGMDRRSRDGLTELNFQFLNTAAITSEEYRPKHLPLGWKASPETVEENWLTKTTEAAYYNAIANKAWQLSWFQADRDNPELEYPRRARAQLLDKNPAFLAEQIFQEELTDKARQIREKYARGKLTIAGDTRYLSDDLMRLLAEIAKPVSAQAYQALQQECLQGAEIYAPQPKYAMPEQVAILRNPHISRNEDVLAVPLSAVGPLRETYLSELHYVAMVDSRSLIPDRLGGADYDGDAIHLYAEPLLCRCIARNYSGGLDNASNLPLLKIPAAEAMIADANDWQARFQTVRSTFSNRIGLISNAALRRSILAYDESQSNSQREQYRRETELLTILTGLEIDSAKTGIKPDLSEYLGNQKKIQSHFLQYKKIVGDSDEQTWYEETEARRLRRFFAEIDWDTVTANLERTPYYARQLWRQTKRLKPDPAESNSLFTFALDPAWKEKIAPDTLERMKSILEDYYQARQRCGTYLHLKPSDNYRSDVQRILFSQNKENEVSADDLYQCFASLSPNHVRSALRNLRESEWQFTPEKDREVVLYTLFAPRRPPDCIDILCDFRCGGYRLLGDVLEDLDAQYQDTGIRKHKGIRSTDTQQMRQMMHGAMDSPDYRETLIRNCRNIICPTFRAEPTQGREYIGWENAVKCAELLGKRSFILEVLPAEALDLAIDCRNRDGEENVQQKRKRGGLFGKRNR